MVQRNDGNVTSLGSLLGVPVKLLNGIADKKIKLTQVTCWYPNWLFSYPAQGTEPNSIQQLRYVGTQ